MGLTKSQILRASDLKTDTVSVPEWGGDVTIRVLSGAELDGYESSLMVQRGKEFVANRANIRARLCALAICDENGQPIFTPPEAAELGKKSGPVLDRIFDAIKQLNGMGSDVVEVRVKNSESGQTESGGTESPSPPETDLSASASRT